MGTPIRHLTPGVIPEKPEQIVNVIFVIGPRRSWAEPHIVVKLSRRFAISDTGASFLVPVHARETHFDGLNFSNAAGADVFTSFQELGIGTLLASSLKHTPVTTH